MSRRVLEHIIDQHAEDAAFLWLQREQAADAHDRGLKELNRLDERLEAHIDGLRVAGEWGWKAAQTAFDLYQEPGETFVASVLAFESQSENRIGYVLNLAETQPSLFRAVVSALGWVERRRLDGTVDALLRDMRARRRLLGVAACSVRRMDPGERLKQLLADEPMVKARALRLAGELGRTDLSDAIAAGLGDTDEACRFWAAWSSVLLGERIGALKSLRGFATSGQFSLKAQQLALRAMEPERALSWLRGLRNDPAQGRLPAAGAGIIGDPVLAPWLIMSMLDPKLARLAAESFATITGVDLEKEQLTGKPPKSGDPDDEPAEEDTARETGLPWPDVPKIQDWWRRNEGAFAKGTRYLCGKPLDATHLETVAREGVQRHRQAAALELALAGPDAPLANCAARTVRHMVPA